MNENEKIKLIKVAQTNNLRSDSSLSDIIISLPMTPSFGSEHMRANRFRPGATLSLVMMGTKFHLTYSKVATNVISELKQQKYNAANTKVHKFSIQVKKLPISSKKFEF